MVDYSKRLYVGLTGKTDDDWKTKIKDINKYKLTEISLFLTRFNYEQRQNIYSTLLKSSVKKIPLVHIRHDMIKEELSFLEENFKSKYFTIHEDGFKILNRWRGHYKKLYLEMDTDNYVGEHVEVSRIGGFCVDLSHFKCQERVWSEEYEYMLKRKRFHKYFACNHINGYSYDKNRDLHTVNSLGDFNYLKTLPEFIFGGVIGIETENPIPQQLKFKDYLGNLLNKIFHK